MTRSFGQWVLIAVLLAAGCSEESPAGESAEAISSDAASVRAAIDTLREDVRKRARGVTEDDTFVQRGAPLADRSTGRVVTRFDRVHAGLRVIGGDVIAHARTEASTSARVPSSLTLESVISRLDGPITASLAPKITEAQAKTIAQTRNPQVTPGATELVLWAVESHRASPKLAWDVRVGSRHVVVSAETGAVLDTYSTQHDLTCGEAGTACTATNITVRPFYRQGTFTRPAAWAFLPGTSIKVQLLQDLGRQIHVRFSKYKRENANAIPLLMLLGYDLSEGDTVISLATAFGNNALFNGADLETSADRYTAAAELYDNLGTTYDFYAGYGRYGFSGNLSICSFNPMAYCVVGAEPIRAGVNVPMQNAVYDSEHDTLAFGYDYNASPSNGPYVELDVVAHEYTHAITEHTAQLIYNDFHSGSLNESVSDAFGRVIAQQKLGISVTAPRAWWVAAGVMTATIPNDVALRYMDDPTLDGVSIDHVSDFPASGLDPHYGSGVPNRAFALLAQWRGRDVAARIWYLALAVCFTSSMTFLDARECTVAAANALYPTTSPDNDTQQWVKNAWNVVGVY